MDYKKLVEALLYIKGEQGLSPNDLKLVTNMPILNARKKLQAFKKEFNAADRGLMIVKFDDTFKFATREELKDDIAQVVSIKNKQKLSNAAIETVGIIAYKQPITRKQINEIRGLSSEAVVNTLLVRGLIEEKGTAKTAGKPLLYGITTKFYDYFKISSLKELPKLSEFNEPEEIDENFELYSSQRED